MRVLVTRPQPDADRTAARLAAMGHEAIVAPLQAVRPLAVATPHDAFDAVAVTSANAVRHAGKDLVAALRHLPCFAVGSASATAASERFADVRAGSGDARALAATLARVLPAGSHVAYLAGRTRKDELERRLADAGLAVSAFETYETVAVPPTPDALARPADAALVYSAGAARRLAAAFPAVPARVVCISADAAAALPAVWRARAVIAARPDEAALFEALTAP